VSHLVKFCADRSNRCRDIAIFIFFEDSICPPSWICITRVWNARQLYLVVFVPMQNLVAVAFYFVHIRLENAYSYPIKSFLGDLTHKMGSSMNETPKRHFVARKHVV